MKALTAAAWSARVGAPAPGPATRSPAALDLIASLVAMAAVVGIAGPAMMAQDAEPTEAKQEAEAPAPSTFAPPTSELMIAGYGGAPYTYPSDVTIKKDAVHDFTAKDVGWDGEPFDSPIYYGVRIVRWFGEGRTGSMLDFTHSKTLARLAEEAAFSGTIGGEPAPERAPLKEIFRRLEASHGHNMLTLNGLFRLPDLGTRFFPYVGLGAGVALPHSEVQMIKDPGRTYEYQYTGPVAQAVIGLEFRIPRMSYFVEYKFTLASYEMPLTHRDGSILFVDLWRQFSRWYSGEAPPGGFLSTNLVSHEGIFGLGVRFGPASVAAP